MSTVDTLTKKQRRQETIVRLIRSIGIGLAQGAICSMLGFLLTLINDFSLFGVLGFWLIFGWFTPYVIRNKSYEILSVIISGVLVSMLVYYFIGIPIWFSSIITGLSLLLWTISLTSKLLLYPIKQKSSEE